MPRDSGIYEPESVIAALQQQAAILQLAAANMAHSSFFNTERAREFVAEQLQGASAIAHIAMVCVRDKEALPRTAWLLGDGRP